MCRTDSNQTPVVNDHGLNQENHLNDSMVQCSNTLDLPPQSYQTARCLGIRSGYSVSRPGDSETQTEDKRPAKRKYECPAFEDEVPFVPFSELPHPKALFGKRSRIEKKEKFKASAVDSHKMQLHKKLAQSDLIQAELSWMKDDDYEEDTAHIGKTHHSQLDGPSYKKALSGTLPEDTSFKSSKFEDSSSDLFSWYDYPSVTAYFQRTDRGDRDSQFLFHSNQTKSYEE